MSACMIACFSAAYAWSLKLTFVLSGDRRRVAVPGGSASVDTWCALFVRGPGSGRAAGATEAAPRRRAPGAGGSPAAGTLRARGDDTPTPPTVPAPDPGQAYSVRYL